MNLIEILRRNPDTLTKADVENLIYGLRGSMASERGMLDVLFSLLSLFHSENATSAPTTPAPNPDDVEEGVGILIPTPEPDPVVAATRPRGLSLHIGLNQVSPAAYGGWDGKLNACRQDAADMYEVAHSLGYESYLLPDSKATRDDVSRRIIDAAEQLKPGDSFFLTYSGHGGQLPDTGNLSNDEVDKKDETWCLYDGQMIDDEIARLLAKFRRDVRVYVFSDSCHSGTVTRNPELAFSTGVVTVKNTTDREWQTCCRPRAMPTDVRKRAYAAQEHLHRYWNTQRVQAVQYALHPADAAEAGIILLSGCAENQFSMDGSRNGAFTESFLKTWGVGYGYHDAWVPMHKDVSKRLPHSQSPQLVPTGRAIEMGLLGLRPLYL